MVFDGGGWHNTDVFSFLHNFSVKSDGGHSMRYFLFKYASHVLDTVKPQDSIFAPSDLKGLASPSSHYRMRFEGVQGPKTASATVTRRVQRDPSYEVWCDLMRTIALGYPESIRIEKEMVVRGV